ncbi:MAG: ABC transporter ATP-binding protein [Clostridia bacterium]|nr:ABC transporter ATP-binding protein [Clostridia bacterium]
MRELLKQFFPFMKKYIVPTILAPLFIIGEVILEIQIPLLMSKIVDIGIKNMDINYVINTGLKMVLFALLALICGALSARFAAVAGMGFGSEVRRGVFNKIQNFSFANIDKFSTASLVTRLTSDITHVQHSYIMIIRTLVRSPFMLVGAIIMASKINAKLVLVFLLAAPILGISLAIIAKTAFKRFGFMLKKLDNLNGSIQENLIGIRVVKAFVRARHEKEKFALSNDDLMKFSINAEKVIICNGPIMQLVMYSTIIAIMWFGGNMIVAGSMETGALISFISYVSQILTSLMMISMMMVMVVLSRASIGRLSEILSEKPDISDENASSDISAKDSGIEFKNVSFKYGNGGEVLKNINLKIEPGETIGIIGGTGSSKTTLVQLIARLYDATEGEVLVGGVNVKDYKIENLRKHVAMVLQKNVLFSGTIKENLKWGDIEASDEEIIKACKNACAHDFIMSFPDGYDTYLGQGGVNVSGGQKQRLCIARALIKKPEIIILDDSTSAVDTATDAKIRSALKEDLKGTTTIIIAQRITSVSDADRIVVLDDGKINAIGTHEELLKNNDIYKEVYNSQQKGVA